MTMEKIKTWVASFPEDEARARLAALDAERTELEDALRLYERLRERTEPLREGTDQKAAEPQAEVVSGEVTPQHANVRSAIAALAEVSTYSQVRRNSQVREELVRRGWLTPNASQGAVDRGLREMVEAGEIERVGYGRYVLSPPRQQTSELDRPAEGYETLIRASDSTEATRSAASS